MLLPCFSSPNKAGGKLSWAKTRRDTSLASIQGPPPSLLSQTARPPQGVPGAQPASSATLSSGRTGGSEALRGSASFTVAKHHLKAPAFVSCDDVVILKQGWKLFSFFLFLEGSPTNVCLMFKITQINNSENRTKDDCKHRPVSQLLLLSLLNLLLQTCELVNQVPSLCYSGLTVHVFELFIVTCCHGNQRAWFIIWKTWFSV